MFNFDYPWTKHKPNLLHCSFYIYVIAKPGQHLLHSDNISMSILQIKSVFKIWDLIDKKFEFEFLDDHQIFCFVEVVKSFCPKEMGKPLQLLPLFSILPWHFYPD